ncbi:glutamate-gated chloride channel-like [Hetaerina americana]|uniref:glutamate-gated chloride channel-like n=1 Tax=Hetaerina americana TaxID=62018 RepID=UPI003A7F1C45
MESLLRVLVFLAAIACALAARNNSRESETELLRQIINPERYDKRVRPPAHGETEHSPNNGSNDYTLVRVNTLIRSIGPIDDHSKDYTVSLTLRQAWNDRRLQFSPHHGLKYITLTSVEDIWSPDLFFSNEKEGHINDVLKPNALVRISPNGDVLYSARVTLTLSCPMDMSHFPMDSQICYIRMASYAYPTSALMFLWQEEEPVQFVKSLNAKPFELLGYKTDNFNSKTVTGEFSSIRINFLLKRLTYGYILQLFLPLALLVIASWAPLWLDFNGQERSHVLGTVGRSLIALLCLLTTIAEAARVSTIAPPCSGYSCAIDIWTTWCQIFVALVLLEVVIVAIIDNRKVDLQCTDGTTKSACFPSKSHDGVEAGNSKFEPKMNTLKKWLMEWPTAGQRIDVFCRILFPVVFIIFNVAYWSAHANNLDAASLLSMKKIPI